MSIARNKVGKLYEHTAGRTIIVKVNPTPKTQSERRSVLQTLQRYGRIDMFKKLASPRIFISITSEPETMHKLVTESPFAVDFGRTPLAAAMRHPILMHRSVSPAALAKQDAAETEQKTFKLYVFRPRSYHHHEILSASPLHGPWLRKADGVSPLSFGAEDSFVQRSLGQVVPKDLAWEGLIDWETGDPERRWNIFDKADREERAKTQSNLGLKELVERRKAYEATIRTADKDPRWREPKRW